MSSHIQYTDRATSAGYRLPASTRISSAYHKKCVPAEQRAESQRLPEPRVGAGGGAGGGLGGAAGSGRHTRADFRACNVVIEDKTWRESVGREKKGSIRWEEGWGFLKEYDQKGNRKEPTQPPENLTVYSETVPNTANQRFGHRQKTGAAKAMVDLQHRLSTTNRKKHHKELICYD
ncbi:ciliary microtubule inner protein 5-like [Diadema setosum]|uniref:ciliary microtubule inner protein 5-like n=1 Tax=Diadema setosum TaxID=31175 RepID=UPI003B3B9B3C